MKKNKISSAVIRRMPRYYRHLEAMYKKGKERFSSGTLAIRTGLTASQIRQDLACFGEFGQQGYGYNVKELQKTCCIWKFMMHLMLMPAVAAAS